MIEVQDLTKAYGSVTAVDHVSFTVNKGEILGFLGPNGAGKTTTMRILTGLHACHVRHSAQSPASTCSRISIEVRRRIGYLPEAPPLYPDMTVEAYLDFVAADQERACREARRDRIADALEKTNLER